MSLNLLVEKYESFNNEKKIIVGQVFIEKIFNSLLRQGSIKKDDTTEINDIINQDQGHQTDTLRFIELFGTATTYTEEFLMGLFNHVIKKKMVIYPLVTTNINLDLDYYLQKTIHKIASIIIYSDKPIEDRKKIYDYIKDIVNEPENDMKKIETYYNGFIDKVLEIKIPVIPEKKEVVTKKKGVPTKVPTKVVTKKGVPTKPEKPLIEYESTINFLKKSITINSERLNLWYQFYLKVEELKPDQKLTQTDIKNLMGEKLLETLPRKR